MTKRAAFKQSDVTRLIKGAIRGGMPVGSFKVVVDNGRPTLLPLDAADTQPPGQDAEADWDRALGLE